MLDESTFVISLTAEQTSSSINDEWRERYDDSLMWDFHEEFLIFRKKHNSTDKMMT